MSPSLANVYQSITIANNLPNVSDCKSTHAKKKSNSLHYANTLILTSISLRISDKNEPTKTNIRHTWRGVRGEAHAEEPTLPNGDGDRDVAGDDFWEWDVSGSLMVSRTFSTSLRISLPWSPYLSVRILKDCLNLIWVRLIIGACPPSSVWWWSPIVKQYDGLDTVRGVVLTCAFDPTKSPIFSRKKSINFNTDYILVMYKWAHLA